MYQAPGPALRFSKGALAKLERGEREPSPAGRTRGVVRPAGSSETGEWGFPMDASVMFLDCPAYMDKSGSVRCGLPAEVLGKLHRAVTYVWTVEALDASGARVAASEPVRFRARP